MNDNEIFELKNNSNKQLKKSNRETYEEMLELIKDKKVGFVLNLENPARFLIDLDAAGDFFHRNHEFMKYAIVKQFQYDFISTLESIFNNVKKTKKELIELNYK